MAERQKNAEKLFLNGCVEHLVGNMFRVHGGEWYTVVIGDEPTCQCKDWNTRMPTDGCKHIRAARLWKENATQRHTLRELVVA